MAADKLSGAIDLSSLGKAEAPSQTYVCDVEDGCGLRIRYSADRKKHEDLKDCLDTCSMYVELFFDLERKTQVIAGEYERLATDYGRIQEQNHNLVDANTSLVQENARLRQGN